MDLMKDTRDVINAQRETIADLKKRVALLESDNSALSHENACYSEEQARLEAQIPDEWLEEERNRTTRNACARMMWAERKQALADLADINPASRMRANLLRIRRDKWRATLRAAQRDTFPQHRERCMTKVTRLLAYAASPIDDRGSCGYGDMLAERRTEARQMAKRGFAIACVL